METCCPILSYSFCTSLVTLHTTPGNTMMDALAEVSITTVLGYMAAGLAAFVAAVMWKWGAVAPLATRKGLPLDPNFETFWGIARDEMKQCLKNRTVSIWEYHRRTAESVGWQAYGTGILGGIRWVTVVSPEDVKFVLKSSFANFDKTPTFIKNLDVVLGNGIFNTNGDEWKHQRVASAGLFSRRKLRDRMSTVFGTHAQDLARCFKKHADEGTVVDAQRLFYCYTFDGINRIAFNKNVDSLRGDEDDLAFQAAFDSAMRVMMERFLTAWWPVLRVLNIGFEKQLSNDMKVIDSYMSRVVDGYFDEEGQVRDEVLADDGSLVALFLEHGREEGVTYTKKYLRDMILNAVIAGRDTTGSATTSCIEFLCAHRDWQDKVRAEARQVFGGNLQEALTFDDVSGTAPVTEAVFMEAIRLHPPVPVNEKVAPCGATVYKGEYVGFAPYVINRNPKVWGEDASNSSPAWEWTARLRLSS
eukprot:TRINITY_DN445_c0_g1_i8.p1 TRINITY_DN445_c0_g1~~TRINITY_DN445_c0_g1_i8.p1  ORF type:complete len:473 (+),score=170.66 TRINITY_DN445_c0_g1_i8:3-1421(+)